MAIHFCQVVVCFFSHNKLNVAIKFSQRPWFDDKSGPNDIGAKPPSLQEMPWRPSVLVNFDLCKKLLLSTLTSLRPWAYNMPR